MHLSTTKLLKDKIRTETVLLKAGLRSLTEAVSVTMACSIWKARNEMNTLGLIFQNTGSTRFTRSTIGDKLCQPVPGYPEAASNKLAQIWNMANLSTAKTLGSARMLAQKWYNQNA